MRKTQAIRHLRAMMFGLQRLRANAAETGVIVREREPDTLALSESFAATLWPWVWGEKSILPILAKVLDRVDETGDLEPHDYYNLMYVAVHLEPMIGVTSGIIQAMQTDDDSFPTEVDLNWLRGWDQEGAE